MKLWKPVLAVLAGLGFGSRVCALINPDFTPSDLVEQSELILEVQFGPIEDNSCVCRVSEVLKGKTERKTMTLDLGKAAGEAQAGTMGKCIEASRREPGLLFAGGLEGSGLLHVSGKWIDLRAAGAGDWQAGKTNMHLEGTWAGGTDMLLRVVHYILSDPDAHVPCNEGVSWSGVAKVGNVEGEVTSCGPVDLDGNGKPCLFVSSSKGDRLFHHRDGTLRDVTAEKKLRSRSLVSAWIDCDKDGKVDLLSWDGSSFRLHLQDRNGTIVQTPTPPAEAPADGCVGLSVLDIGGGGPGVLVSTRGRPMLLEPGSLPMKARELVEGDPPAGGLGRAAACLVADFDGDSFPDIVQPFEKGSLFYSGKGPGRFAPPVQCGLALGRGKSAACLGDFDADGLLDIFTTGAEGCEVWQNAGRGGFVPRRRLSGEIAYIAKSGGIACQACDINNDGRQDIFIAYRNIGAQIFFNRGFRSTGHAHKLDLTDNGLLPDAEKGQQTGCIADFNGDGGQDMLLVLKQGDIHVFWRDTQEASPLAVKVDLSSKGPCWGPLTVTGWLRKRCLGAWNVVPATSTGFVGLMEAAPCVIRWRFPGGESREKEVEVEDEARRFLIE